MKLNDGTEWLSIPPLPEVTLLPRQLSVTSTTSVLHVKVDYFRIRRHPGLNCHRMQRADSYGI